MFDQKEPPYQPGVTISELEVLAEKNRRLYVDAVNARAALERLLGDVRNEK